MFTFLIVAAATLLILLALRSNEQLMATIRLEASRSSGITLQDLHLTSFGGPAISASGTGTLRIHGGMIQVRDDCWHGVACVCFKKKRKATRKATRSQKKSA